MRIALFTDTHVVRDTAGRFAPLRDQFIRFISKLSEQVEHLNILSRCVDAPFNSGAQDTLCLSDSFTFTPLPFYRNTEDFYKRYFRIWSRSKELIEEAIADCDIVLLRIHHCLALEIARVANAQGKPIAAYWAGPPIYESVRKNYPGASPKELFARTMARLEQYRYKKIARTAAINLFIDPSEHQLMGAPSRTRFVVPSLITEDSIVPFVCSRAKNEELRLVYAGRVFRHKGIFDLIDALLRLEGKCKYRLIVAGEGPDLNEVRNSVDNAGISGAVEFVGNLKHGELQTIMRKGHVFVLPSYAEGMPKALWEAWAAGLAIVSTPVGCIADHVRAEKNGLLVPPGNVDSLAQSIERLCCDDSLRMKLAEAGAIEAREHTWTKEVENIAQALFGIWAGRAGNRNTTRNEGMVNSDW